MKTILISTLASLASSSPTIQGYLQLRLADQYEENYGQFKLDLCATNFKHEPAASDCKNAPNDGLQLIDQIGMVAQASVTKRSRQVDFGFGFSWPGDLSLITWMHNKPDSFSGQLTPYEDWKPIVFKHTKKVLIDARVVCANNYYGVKCDTYCEGTKNYECDAETGEKKCKDGWQTLPTDYQQCTSPVCDSQCSSHGRCVEPGKCRCDSGYSGVNCDQCQPLPGCVNGGCGDRPYTCKCHTSDWIGGLCDIPSNPCYTSAGQSMCRNNGQCRFDNIQWGRFNMAFSSDDLSEMIQDGKLWCQCPPGFTGDRCEREIVCINGGELDSTGTKCQCPSDTTGQMCEFNSSPAAQVESGSVLMGAIIGAVVIIACIVLAIAAIVCASRFKSSKNSGSEPEFALDPEEITDLTEQSSQQKSQSVRHSKHYGHDRTVSMSETQKQQQQQPPSYNDVVGSSRGDTLIVSSP